MKRVSSMPGRLGLLLLLVLNASGCAAYRFVAMSKPDWDLHEQARLVVSEHGRPGAGHNAHIGRISRDLAPADQYASSINSDSVGVSRLGYLGVTGGQICFSKTYNGSPRWEPSGLDTSLKSWRWVVEPHAALSDFGAADLPWPVPPSSAFDTVSVVRNEVIRKQYEGSMQPRRIVTLQLCGPAPQIPAGANWLAVMKVNPEGLDAQVPGATNELWLWGITDADQVDTGYKGGFTEHVSLGTPTAPRAEPALEPAPAQPPAATPVTAATGDQDVLATIQALGCCATFLKLVETAGLTDTLRTGGPFTVFAPQDSAFSPEWLAMYKKHPEETASEAVKGTMLPELLPLDAVGTKPLKRTTSFGNQIKIVQRSGSLLIDTARAPKIEHRATNGLIYVVDRLVRR